LALILPAVLTPALASESTVQPGPATADPLILPLAFEPNLGQTAAAGTQFLTRGPGYVVLLQAQGARLALSHAPRPGRDTHDHLNLDMRLLQSNAGATAQGRMPLPGRVNYYLGSDPARWHTNIPTYERVAYTGVYPGTDLVYYGQQGQMEFDFVLAPGADPGRIRLQFSGPEHMQIDPAGDLVFRNGNESLAFRRPVAYQQAGNDRHYVEAAFDLSGEREIGFRLGDYDHSRPLIIDPVIQYKTYLGSEGADSGNAVLTDADGNRYIAGNTAIADVDLSNAFTPRSTENIDNKLGGGKTDVFIMKINAAGKSNSILYTAFFGGPGDDTLNAMTLDPDGNVYFVGDTNSPVLPLATRDHDIGLQDAFVAKIDDEGAFAWARYLGGSGVDSGLAIAFHQSTAAGNEKFLYVGGSTASSIPPYICHPADAGDPLDQGDGYVAKISADAGTGTLIGACIGGGKQDQITGVAANDSDEVYFAGTTRSEDLPTATTSFGSPYQQVFAGGAYDGFVGKLANDTATVQYLTYLGGTNDDYIYSMAVDGNGNAYVTGQTSSTSTPVGQFQPLPFPTHNPIQSKHQGGTYDAFVSKIDPKGQALIYSTYLGGNGNDQGLTIKLNSQLHAWVAGTTLSTNFPLANAWQRHLMGTSDGFVAELAEDGTELKFSSYVGGSGDDRINDLAIGRSNDLDRIYVTGTTNSLDLPSLCTDITVACTDTTLQSYYGTGQDAFELDFLAGEAATFSLLTGIATDTAGNIYVADTDNSVIRKISSTGIVTTIAGSAGVTGSADGIGSVARFDHPAGIAVDRNNILYVADTGNSTIRRICFNKADDCVTAATTNEWVVKTMAGIAGTTGSTNNTVGTSATFNHPEGIATDGTDNVFVADTGNSLIRKVAVKTTGAPVTTTAGTAGVAGSHDANIGTDATFDHPSALAINRVDSTIYVADTGNSLIRRITTSKVVTTLAGTAGVTGGTDGTGTAAQFNAPRGIAADTAGNVYVADTGNSTIRNVTTTGAIVTTLSGTAGTPGSTNGTKAEARYSQPRGIAVDSLGNLYVADTGNFTVRKIAATTDDEDDAVTTLTGTPGATGHTDGFGTADAHHPIIGMSIAKQIGPIEVVNTYVYDITVSNTSDVIASGLVVQIRMDNAILRDATGNDANGNAEHCLITAGTVATCNVGNLAAGATAPVTVLALPNTLGKATVTVTFLRANQSVDALQDSVSETTLIIDSSGGYGSLSWDFYALALLGLLIGKSRGLVRSRRPAVPGCAGQDKPAAARTA
jgi:hypothetical protein